MLPDRTFPDPGAPPELGVGLQRWQHGRREQRSALRGRENEVSDNWYIHQFTQSTLEPGKLYDL